MKKVILSCLIALCLALPISCSNKYVITTKDGTEFICESEPAFNKKTQSYDFTDVNGKRWIIDKSLVRSMGWRE